MEDPDIQALVDILWRHGDSGGLRVAQLHELMPDRKATQIQAMLARCADLGRVSRSMAGRWTPVGARPTTQHPTAQAAGARAIPVGRSGGTGKVGLPDVQDLSCPDDFEPGQRTDPSQQVAIEAPLEARQVVRAGPGFGKTRVACERVAQLLRRGCPPARILLLSFTRTAVREMRCRIQQLAASLDDAAAVEIRTLDSFAWRLCRGYSEFAPGGGSYQGGIAEAASLLASRPDALDYVANFRHVLVDEAQDLTGSRAALVCALLQALPGEAGYTVFHDPAQAIYDWCENGSEDGHVQAFGELVSGLRPAPSPVELGVLHRTRDPGLRKLLLGARKLVLDDSEPDRTGRLQAVLEAWPGFERPTFESIVESARTAADDTLFLFRRRAEALLISSYLASNGVRHRLRLGGLPDVAAPWIAAVINSASAGRPVLKQRAVEDAWTAMEGTEMTSGWDFPAAWRALRRMGAAPDRREIDARRIAQRLASGSIPDELTMKEIGGAGPIVGTVHGSKGREADVVHLLLGPPTEGGDEAEARVLYVGLSRARESLHVAGLGPIRFGQLLSGRVWKAYPNASHVEVGRAGDLDFGRAAIAAGADLSRQQAALAAFPGSPQPVCVSARRENNWRRDLLPRGMAGPPLSVVSPACERELGQAVRPTPNWINHLWWFDLTTVALPEGHPALEAIPEPWRSTRLMLAPVISGLGHVAKRK